MAQYNNKTGLYTQTRDFFGKILVHYKSLRRLKHKWCRSKPPRETFIFQERKWLSKVVKFLGGKPKVNHKKQTIVSVSWHKKHCSIALRESEIFSHAKNNYLQNFKWKQGEILQTVHPRSRFFFFFLRFLPDSLSSSLWFIFIYIDIYLSRL